MREVAQFETRLLNSLAKVFPDEAPRAGYALREPSALRNEVYSFQLAYRSDRLMKNIQVRVVSDVPGRIRVYSVGLVPSELPCYHDHDGRLLRSSPGLFPDPLIPVGEEGVSALPGGWGALWIEVEPPADSDRERFLPATSIDIRLTASDGELLGRERMELQRIAAALPEQRLVHTEWFHADCLATAYGVEVFSEAHWENIEQFVRMAVDHGVNMLLTPLFTPPLDTQVGGERPTVQLIDVVKRGEQYDFGFGKLARWIDLGERCGIRWFECSHLFTQWGARHAPKVMAVEDGRMRRVFGWDTDAAGEPYKQFLDQLLPRLVQFIRHRGLEDRVYFHVSDEPRSADFDSYSIAMERVSGHLQPFPVIDALSDYDFYAKGVVRRPVPKTDHIEPFLEHGVPELWTYYCCSQYRGVSNRYFAFPSERNRVIGMQLFRNRICGFLHWGYNFWYSRYSVKALDPWKQTDADRSFPSGDPFLVYPGEDGPVASIRLKVFREALQDLRALQLLESRIGRDAAVALLEHGLDRPLGLDHCPEQPEWLIETRARINRAIAGHGGEE